jgi:hypothetical protein
MYTLHVSLGVGHVGACSSKRSEIRPRARADVSCTISLIIRRADASLRSRGIDLTVTQPASQCVMQTSPPRPSICHPFLNALG